MDCDYRNLLHTYFTERIDALHYSKKAKDTLRKTLAVVESNNQTIKNSAKSLFVISSTGAGISDYAKLYDEILEAIPYRRTNQRIKT